VTVYRDTGIVLRTYRLGEADRIVVVLTPAHGKVRAVAKGVRKTKSRFGARLEPLSHCAFLFYEGRDLDIVSQADVIDHFATVRGDLDRLTKGIALCEAVDLITHEREPGERRYQMLLGALRALAAADRPLLVPAFFWKLLDAEGYRPEVDACVACGSDGPLVAFDLDQGGALCRSCRQGVAVSPEVFVLLQQILGGGLVAALNEPASTATHELESLATRAMEHNLERRLRAMGVLGRL
jgi:DNA repair protein RecO (recombination protein O)